MGRVKKRRLGLQRLENRQLLAAGVVRIGDTAHLISDVTPEVHRFDMASETWLPSVALPRTTAPTVAHADDSGYYVAFGKALYAYDDEGSSERFLLATDTEIRAIETDGNLILVHELKATTVLNRVTGQIYDHESRFAPLRGFSNASGINRSFAVSEFSPNDIYALDYEPDGTLGTVRDSPYHGSYDIGSQTWVSPDEAYVFTSAGHYYDTETLAYAGSLGVSIDVLAFADDGRVVAIDDGIFVVFDGERLLLEGASIGITVDHTFLKGESAYLFTETNNAEQFVVNVVEIEEGIALPKASSVSPEGLVYEPDQIIPLEDQSLLVYSRRFGHLFRYDLAGRRYTDSIALLGAPGEIAYSQSENAVYTGYKDGFIFRIDLSKPEPIERPFVTLAGDISGLTATEHALLVRDGSDHFYSINLSGDIVSQRSAYLHSGDLVYHAGSRQVFGRDQNSPRFIYRYTIDDQGVFELADTYYDSQAPAMSGLYPNEDASLLFNGVSRLFDVSSESYRESGLPGRASDAAWLGEHLYTLHQALGNYQIERWTPGRLPSSVHQRGPTAQVVGSGALLAAVDGTIVVVSVDHKTGIPTFTVYDTELNELAPPQPSVAVRWDELLTPSANPSTSSSLSEPDQGSHESHQSFGVVSQGESLAMGFTIFNEGNATLQVDRVEVVGSDNWKIASLDGQVFPLTIKPGGHRSLTLTFDGASAGNFRTDVRVHTDDPDSPVQTVTSSGRVRPGVKYDRPGRFQADEWMFELDLASEGVHERPGPSSLTFRYGGGSARWTPLVGDWNGDGADTVGLYQPDLSLFHLRDSHGGGVSDQYFAFGPRSADWIPLAGDWNGDGIDTIGLYQPDISLFHLKDSFTPGASDHYFAFGPGGNAGWVPLVGDWDGDGVDTIGLYQPDLSLFHLKNSFTPGASDQYFAFGPSGIDGWIPVTGDWDGNGTDTVGLYQTDEAMFHLKDTFEPGASDHYFIYEKAGGPVVPLTGDWNGSDPNPSSGRIVGDRSASLPGVRRDVADLSQSVPPPIPKFTSTAGKISEGGGDEPNELGRTKPTPVEDMDGDDDREVADGPSTAGPRLFTRLRNSVQLLDSLVRRDRAA